VNLKKNAFDINAIRKQLQPCTTYKFRVAGINACGIGEFSEPVTFTTSTPGLPGPPSSIKINKACPTFCSCSVAKLLLFQFYVSFRFIQVGNDTQVSWEPPQNPSGTIKEYSLFLAVKAQDAVILQQQQVQATAPPNVNSNKNQMSFVLVYCGIESHCIVNSEQMQHAYIDVTAKPAILFRIATRNEKGYGPATQVRWLQENQTGATAAAVSSLKRNSTTNEYVHCFLEKFLFEI
jgi:host cell factor